MTRWLVIPGVLACTVAGAEVAEYEPRMTLHPGERICFAVVRIENISGVYNETERLETEHGPVSIRYETIGSHNATDHDLVDVVDLPAGVAANPMHLDLPDGETGYICLMEYLGG